MTTDFEHKDIQGDEWLAHALRKAQWPAPSASLKHRILMGAATSAGERVPFYSPLFSSQLSFQAGFCVLFLGAYLIGAFMPLPTQSVEPSALSSSFYEGLYTQESPYSTGGSL